MGSFGKYIKTVVRHWEHTSDVSHSRSTAYGIISGDQGLGEEVMEARKGEPKGYPNGLGSV
jgi:hypothetical protein